MTIPGKHFSLKAPRRKTHLLFIFKSTTLKLMAIPGELLAILRSMCWTIFAASSFHFRHPVIVNPDFAPPIVTSKQDREHPCLASSVVKVPA